MLTAGWESPLGNMRHEVTQREYEGCVVPVDIKEKLAAMTDDSDADSSVLASIKTQLEALQPDKSFRYIQPNDLASIRAQRPEGPRQLPLELNEARLLDRLHGAWTGRSAGCALGKPVEGIGINGCENESGRSAIKRYLKARQQWPLDNYFSETEVSECEIKIACPQSCRENISHMEPDDDIHYSLLGLKVLEEKGRDFQWQDVADMWNQSLPYSYICTAEAQAILNYNIGVPRIRMRSQYVTPEFTRHHNNPYREWIGAQIRADGWAYCCAGNPELAAEFAWRDAHWTHTANGIYGEMFFAAMIAAAFVVSDPQHLVEIALSEIPEHCKLAEAIRQALVWIDECDDFEAFMEQVEHDYSSMSHIHTVNNALIVIMALFYGEMNPDRSLAIAVMAGLDTDCNGATVGSIVGAINGHKQFGGVLKAPLNDTIKPMVFGFENITMTELAQRTLAVHKTIRVSSPE